MTKIGIDLCSFAHHTYIILGREGWMQGPWLDENNHILPGGNRVLSGSNSRQLFFLWQLGEWGVAENNHRWEGEVRLCWTSLHEQVLRLYLRLWQPDHLQFRKPWHLHRRLLLSSLDCSNVRNEIARGFQNETVLLEKQRNAWDNRRSSMSGSRCRKSWKKPMQKLEFN